MIASKRKLHSRQWIHVALPMLVLLGLVGWWSMGGPDRLALAQQSGKSAVVPAADTGDKSAAPVAGFDTRTIPDKNMWEIFQAGGILMYPIAFCSFILVVFVFERTISLRRPRVIPAPFVKRFMHQMREGQLDREQALQLCEENKSAVADVFAGALRKWGRPSVEVEQAILDSGERAVNGLRRYVRVFNSVATVTPLLGLLGTVFGMIRTFNAVAGQGAMGNPTLLASGISEALLTTAAGLTVAIPALTCYLYFISRVDQLVIELDALGQELVGLISAEAIQEATQTKSTRVSRRESAA
jgi:biopolymer transport protein ExbB